MQTKIKVDLGAAQKAMGLLGILEIEKTLEQARAQETLNDISSIKNAFARASIAQDDPAPAGEDNPASPAGLPPEVKDAVAQARDNVPEAPDVPTR